MTPSRPVRASYGSALQRRSGDTRSRQLAALLGILDSGFRYWFSRLLGFRILLALCLSMPCLLACLLYLLYLLLNAVFAYLALLLAIHA